MDLILYILMSLALSFLWAPIIIGILYRLKFRQKGKAEVDEKIKSRKKTIGVPVMGGFIIVIPLLLLYFFLSLHQSSMGYIPVVILVIGAAIGFLDDYLDLFGKVNGSKTKVYSKVNPFIYRNFLTWSIYRWITWPFRIFNKTVDDVGSIQSGLRASHKLLLELGLAVGISYWWYKMSGDAGDPNFWLPIIGELNIGWWIVPISTLIMVAFSAAFTITDGLDAISPGTHAIAYFLMGLVANYLGYTDVAILCMLVLGTELTFYYFNIPPARVEMSDVGTVPMGMLFAFIGLATNRLMILPIVGFIFVAEILSTILQSFSAMFFTKKVFKMAPIHHHFEMMGWSREKIVMRFYFVAIVVGLMGMVVAMW